VGQGQAGRHQDVRTPLFNPPPTPPSHLRVDAHAPEDGLEVSKAPLYRGPFASLLTPHTDAPNLQPTPSSSRFGGGKAPVIERPFCDTPLHTPYTPPPFPTPHHSTLSPAARHACAGRPF
jgi:hypothetical protein